MNRSSGIGSPAVFSREGDRFRSHITAVASVYIACQATLLFFINVCSSSSSSSNSSSIRGGHRSCSRSINQEQEQEEPEREQEQQQQQQQQ